MFEVFAYPHIYKSNDGLRLAETHTNRFVFINEKGIEIGGKDWKKVRPYYGGLASVCSENGLWGFIDKYGNLVNDYQYSDAFSLENGKTLIKNPLENFYIIKDEQGSVLFTIPRGSVIPFTKPGIFCANNNENGKFGLISENDSNITLSKYHFMCDFDEKTDTAVVAIISKNDIHFKEGYIKSDGTESKIIYEKAYGFKEGVGKVIKQVDGLSKETFLDINFEEKYPFFIDLEYPSEGMARCSNDPTYRDNPTYYYLNVQTGKLSEIAYRDSSDFYCGFAKVMSSGKAPTNINFGIDSYKTHTIIDKNFEPVVEPLYNIRYFTKDKIICAGNPLISSSESRYCGFFDFNLNPIHNLRYHLVYRVGNFWYAKDLYNKDKYGLLDINGNIIMPFEHNTIDDLNNAISELLTNELAGTGVNLSRVRKISEPCGIVYE